MRSWLKTSCPPWAALLVIAAALVAAWGAVHLAGWREHTGAFSVVVVTGPGQETAFVKAVVYAGAHLLLVLVVPVLTLAALLLGIVERARR